MTEHQSNQHLVRKPKILIAYANTGGGHLSAARAIEAAIHERYPQEYDVLIMNLSAASRSQSVTMLYESYNFMLKAGTRYAKPGLKLLNTVDIERMLMPMVRRAVGNIRRTIIRERPDLIVSVHGMLNHLLLRLLKDCDWLGKVPYVIVCTDLTDNFLKGWANPQATRVITFTEMARAQMMTYGVAPEKITVHRGFPVNPSFFTADAGKQECRDQLGLDANLFTALVSLGGMAIPSKTKSIVKALLTSGLPLQVVVVCGTNRSLTRRMHTVARTSTMPLHVYGFTQRIPQMMSAADVMITKPGPGTIMEAVIKELPLLLDNVTEPMPQEKGNLRYALEQGVALEFTSYRQLPQVLAQLMQDHAAYAQMQEQMSRLKNEQGIFEVVESILAELPRVPDVDSTVTLNDNML